MEPCCDGQFVAIDVQSGEYEVAAEAEEASGRLWARCPQAQILIERVGHRAAFHAYRSAGEALGLCGPMVIDARVKAHLAPVLGSLDE